MHRPDVGPPLFFQGGYGRHDQIWSHVRLEHGSPMPIYAIGDGPGSPQIHLHAPTSID